MTEHALPTDGEWRRGDGVNRCAVFARGVQIGFARQDNNHISASEAEANARMFAASQAMRDALSELLAEIDHAQSHDLGACHIDALVTLKARAVLASTTGAAT